MAFKRGERDHRDMLTYQGPNTKANEPVYYSKPDWMVEAPVIRYMSPQIVRKLAC